MALPTGKLPAGLLARLLEGIGSPDPRVLLGPGMGRDAAVVDLGGGRCLVAASDPVTFASDEIGWYAVHVNANDVATTGAEPRWFLATLLLPEGRSDAALAETIFDQVKGACAEVGAALVGGHTEVSHGLDRPILSGTMLGEVAQVRLVLPTGARPGDVLLLTKSIALEATALLAREKPEALAALDPALVERARGFLKQPGISVLREARAATAAADVHAMHDPTEGGLATALHELAEASNVGLEIRPEAVPVLPETRAICRAVGVDPWGALASGALLLAVDEVDATRVLDALVRAGVVGARIGRVVERARGVNRATGVELVPLARFGRDEIARVL